MATTYKFLAQDFTGANDTKTIYTAPANTQTIVSKLYISRIAGNEISIYVVKSGDTASFDNIIFRKLGQVTTEGFVFDENNVYVVEDITLDTGDSIVVAQSNTSGDVNYHLFGVEIS